MKFNGSHELNSNIENVWKNLNDPDILKECIDGCSEFSTVDNNKFKAKILIKLGPVNASFVSNIYILNINEPDSYEIEANGNAGNLGFASGNVKVTLKSIGNKTVLNYDANSRINGKLAQLGSRLIDGSIKKNTEKFFKNFETTLGQSNIENTSAPVIKNKPMKSKKIILIIALIIITLIILFYLVIYGK